MIYLRDKKLIRNYNTSLTLGNQSLFLSVNKQKNRLNERRLSSRYTTQLNGLNIVINRGVYRTGIDTELMIEVLKKKHGKTFLEIGCGSGAISLSVASRYKQVCSVDINELAVKNTLVNCCLNNINNIEVKPSDVFSNVNGLYDVIVCNPPYNNQLASDNIDKMFWDTKNEMKLNFFKHVKNFLHKDGRIYFGWADFADLEFNFPVIAAKKNGLKLIKVYSKPSKCSSYRFMVFEFAQVFNS